MHLVLTGATGLVDTAVLDAMIRTKDITKITVLSRRPVKFTDDRINVIIHKDFASYDHELLDKLRGAQACVWALGISQTEVSKESVSSPRAPFASPAVWLTLIYQGIHHDNENLPTRCSQGVSVHPLKIRNQGTLPFCLCLRIWRYLHARPPHSLLRDR